MIKRFFSQAWLYHKGRTAAYKLSEFALNDIGYPIITLIFYCLLAAYGFQTQDLTHWVIGNAFLLCTDTCIYNLGGIFRAERFNGRLRSIVVAPYSVHLLVLASGVFPAIVAAITVTFNFIVGGTVFNISFTGIDISLAFVILACGMISATCFGLFLSTFGLITSSMYLLLNIVSHLLHLFTGAQFPITQLPAAIQPISKIIPLTRSIQAMDCLFEGENHMIFALVSGELGVAFIYYCLAMIVFRIAERISRISGKLDMY